MSEQPKPKADDSPPRSTPVEQDDTLEGIVTQVRRDSVRLRLPHGIEGEVAKQELRLPTIRNRIRRLEIGKATTVRIVKLPQGNRCAIVSLLEVPLDEVWDSAHQMLKQKEVLELRVVAYNKGGLVVDYFGFDAFVPRSQILNPETNTEAPIQPDNLPDLVGHTLALRLIEVDRNKNRIILSERAAGHAAQARRGGKVLSAFQEGQVYRGRVANLSDFGAFVDLGGINGLIHLSELSLDKVTHPSQVVQVGDEVDVMVLRVDQRKHYIYLSLKALKPDPWDQIEKRYFVGQWVEGEVQSLVDYGAFVRIEEGLVGLLHVSELSEESIEYPVEVLREKQLVMVRILHIDTQRRRLGLSLLPDSVEQKPENVECLEEYDLFDPLWDSSPN